jgi:hypothetical protein
MAQVLGRDWLPSAMIKLVSAETKDARHLLLRFSDGAWGVLDFSRYIDAATEMTRPLADPGFFLRHFIEAGALEWPNGFDLSAQGLYERLRESGGLRRDAEAA